MHAGLVGDVTVEITKWKDVALSKLKMDCRCRKLSLSLCQFLSAVGVLEQDCRYIFSNFEAMSPVAKTPWKASL